MVTGSLEVFSSGGELPPVECAKAGGSVTDKRAGRPMKPIPEDRPARLLGEKLRLLKGDLTYHHMGKVAHLKHNTLSTTADGTYRGWPSVQQFLDAIEACGGTVTDEDVAECRALHQIGYNLYRESQQTEPAAPGAGPLVGAGEQPVHDFTRIAEGEAYPAAALDSAQTMSDIVNALIDLVMARHLPPDSWRKASYQRQGFDTSRSGRTGAPEWEVLTGRRPPTLPLVHDIVHRCGGGADELARWDLAWNRVIESPGQVVGVAEPPASARDRQLQNTIATSTEAGHDAGQAAGPHRPPWWRRLRQRLFARPSGAADPAAELRDPDEPTDQLNLGP